MRWLVWGGGIIGAICLLLYLFVVDAWTVPKGADNQFGASIQPTMMINDVVLVQRGRVPKYGELARCINPVAAGVFVVGRVFGEGGDRVEVKDGVISTSGKVLASRHGCPPVVVPHPTTENLITMTCGVAETGAWSFSFLTDPVMSAGHSSALVETGKLYLVSDNRTMHEDSRDFGQVEASTCEHVIYRLWGERFTDSSRRNTILW